MTCTACVPHSDNTQTGQQHQHNTGVLGPPRATVLKAEPGGRTAVTLLHVVQPAVLCSRVVSNTAVCSCYLLQLIPPVQLLLLLGASAGALTAHILAVGEHHVALLILQMGKRDGSSIGRHDHFWYMYDTCCTPVSGKRHQIAASEVKRSQHRH